MVQYPSMLILSKRIKIYNKLIWLEQKYKKLEFIYFV